MEQGELIVYGLGAINTLALIGMTFMLNTLRAKVESLSAKDERLHSMITSLEVRLAKLEVLSQTREDSIKDISSKLDKVIASVVELRAHYDKNIADFFETYDLTKKKNL